MKPRLQAACAQDSLPNAAILLNQPGRRPE
jgi:hypothetical protein